MSGMQLEWLRLGGGGAEAAAPNGGTEPARLARRGLVVLLPWVWAESRHAAKYVDVCHEAGWDVLLVRWPMLAMWVPGWSTALAARLLDAVGAELEARGERPVVFWCFSGAAKGVYASLLALLARPQQLRAPSAARRAALLLRCACGQMFDSGPVDFTSHAGRQLLTPVPRDGDSASPAGAARIRVSSSPADGGSSSAAAAAQRARAVAGALASAGVNVAAGALDFCLLEAFDADCERMWTALKHPPFGGPVLLLYSRSDPLVDPALLASMAAALQARGRFVLQQVWQDSTHVDHLRAHPGAYRDAVAFLLRSALQEWASRSSRQQEGVAWAARWDGEAPQPQLQPPQAPASLPGAASSSSSSSSSSSGQEGQLVMQPTLGRHRTGRGHHAPGSSAARHAPPPAQLHRSGTSARTSDAGGSSDSSDSSGGGAQHTAHLLRLSQLPLSDASLAAHAAAAAQPAPAATITGAACDEVTVSSWPATASAVAAALSAAGGSELSCADATLLAHSLRCMASSFVVTHLHRALPAPPPPGSSNGGLAAAAGQQAQPAAQQPDRQQAQAQAQQRSQPFVHWMVSRIRSKL